MLKRINLQTERDKGSALLEVQNALEAGKLVVLPTETVYGVAALASNENAVKRLLTAKGRAGDKPCTVAIHGLDMLKELVPELTPFQQRLARRCWPGPITIVIPVKQFERFGDRLPENVKKAIISTDGKDVSVGFRVPNHPFTLELLKSLNEPIILSSANKSGEGDCFEPDEIAKSLGNTIDIIVEDGSVKDHKPSTVVFVGNSNYSILREGALSSGVIERLTAKIIIFVCTGNTCRSPMAEVLCRAMIAKKLGCPVDEVEKRGYVILSAGIAASDQSPASTGAQEAIRNRGLSLIDHLSQPLNETHIRFADKIYTMTRSHREAILSLWPEADTRLTVLRTDDGDIADPYGGNLAQYENCAQQIERELIKRSGELG